MNLKAFIANSLYSWEKAGKREAIPRISYLEGNHLVQRCCCKQQWYKRYSQTLSAVEKDTLGSLNLINFLRRLRQHHIALNFILNNK